MKRLQQKAPYVNYETLKYTFIQEGMLRVAGYIEAQYDVYTMRL